MSGKTIEELVEELVGEAAGIAGNPILSWKQVEHSLEILVKEYVDKFYELGD